MRHRQWIYFAPYWANFIACTAVHALTCIKNAAAHWVALYISVVTFNLCVFFLEVIFRKVGMCCIVAFDEVRLNLVVNFFAVLLVVVAALCLCIASVIRFFLYLLAEFFVIHFVAIFALNVCTEFLCKFFLYLAHRLDSIVRCFKGVDKVLFWHLVHFALHHHNVVLGGTDHNIHIGFLHLFEGRVDDIFSVYTCYAHFRDGVFDRNIRALHSYRCCKSCQGIGHINAVSWKKHYIHEYFCVIIWREKGTKHTVYKTWS